MERVYWGAGDKFDRDSRFTPPDFIAYVHTAFGEIDLDPCAHRLSPVVAHRRILLDEGGNGLVDNWSGRLAFVNPPFSELTRWPEQREAFARLVPGFWLTRVSDADRSPAASGTAVAIG